LSFSSRMSSGLRLTGFSIATQHQSPPDVAKGHVIECHDCGEGWLSSSCEAPEGSMNVKQKAKENMQRARFQNECR
jgi:hypothetical protein